MSIIDITCKINNKIDKNIKIKIEESEEYISHESIQSKVYQNLIEKEIDFLEENNLYNIEKEDINFEYIRYFDKNSQGWVLLDEKSFIALYKEKDINLLVKLRIKTKDEKEIISKYNEIEELFNDMTIRNKKNKNNKIINYDTELDLCVLTANPLFDNNSNKELKSINDFNNITQKILNVVRNSTKLIFAEFYPLTKQYLKKIIFDKPKIIHLICKSTYILPKEIGDNFKSYNYVNLLFEDDNFFSLKKINKKELDDIFDKDVKIKEIIKNIILVISTQLSEDVYKMVKNYGFKNVFVQHTTVADSTYISEFNEQFYKNIIMSNNDHCGQYYYSENIDNINLTEESYQFCCCFHEHESNCEFMKHLNNDLYINEIENNKNEIKVNKNKDDKKDGIKFIFPLSHFSHLFYKCKCKRNEYLKESKCLENNEYIDKKESSLCCCFNKKYRTIKKKKINDKPKKHFKIDIFFNDFKEKQNVIKLGNGIDTFGKIKNDIIPQYDTMKFIVGRNKIIYTLYKKISESDRKLLINVYSNGKQNYELQNLPYIIKEYFQERIHLLFNQNNKQNVEINNISNKNLHLQDIDDKNEENLAVNRSKSAPIEIMKYNQKNFNYEIKVENIKDFNVSRMKDNTIYFIISFDNKNLREKINEIIREQLRYKIIFFTEKKIDEEFNKLNIESLEMRPLSEEEYNIKYQTEKIKKSKEDFKLFISEEKIRNDNDDNLILIKNNNESTIKYELLFFFSNIKSEIYEIELKLIYFNNTEKIKNEITKIFNEFNNIEMNEIESEFNKVINNIKEAQINEKNNNEKNNIVESNRFNVTKEKINEIFNKIKKIIVNNRFFNEEKKLGELINIKNMIDNEFKNINEKINDKINSLEKELKKKNYSLKIIDGIKTYRKDILNEIKIFEENEFYYIKEIIDNEFNVLITSPKDAEKKIAKYKINYNFNLYYENWKNKISNEIKQKILIKLFKYYSIIFRDISKKEDLKELGIWHNYNKGIKDNIEDKQILDIIKQIKNIDKNIEKSFQTISRNFVEILKQYEDESIYICTKCEEVKAEMTEYLKIINIYYYTCCIIFDKMNDSEIKKIKKLLDLFNKDICFDARLILLKWMKNPDIINFQKLEKILTESSDNKYKKEELENKFAESIKKVEERPNEINLNEPKETKEYGNNKEKRFLFINIVKYIYYKFKVKNGICDNEDLKDLNEDTINKDNIIQKKGIIKFFKEAKEHLYEIKSYLLIGEWYLYNKEKKDMEKFYEYLNFAIYVCNLYNNQNINIYMSNYIKEKKLSNKKIKKEENKVKYDKIIENMKILCSKYNYENKDNNLEYYIDNIDN